MAVIEKFVLSVLLCHLISIIKNIFGRQEQFIGDDIVVYSFVRRNTRML